MKWNWQQTDWPNFHYEEEALQVFERLFCHQSGFLLGIGQHLDANERKILTTDIMSDEA